MGYHSISLVGGQILHLQSAVLDGYDNHILVLVLLLADMSDLDYYKIHNLPGVDHNNPGYYYGQRQEDYGFYNSQDHSCRQGGGQGPGYGYHNHQEQHFAGGGFDHQQGRSSGNPSCAMGGGGMNPSNNVWYYTGQS